MRRPRTEGPERVRDRLFEMNTEVQEGGLFRNGHLPPIESWSRTVGKLKRSHNDYTMQ